MNKCDSAFPIQDGSRSEGMTLGAYAAIHLKRPCSGIDWLDEEIRFANREEIRTKILLKFVPDDLVLINHKFLDGCVDRICEHTANE